MTGSDNKVLLKDPVETISYLGPRLPGTACLDVSFSQEAGGVGAQIASASSISISKHTKDSGSLASRDRRQACWRQGAGKWCEGEERPRGTTPLQTPSWFSYQACVFHSLYVSMKYQGRPAHQCPK